MTTPPAFQVKILIADDNAESTAIIAMLLELEGYQVKTATTGEAALSIAEAFLPHVMLLDIRMPGMDGYAICRHLKTQTRGHPIHVIGQSGLPPAHEYDRAMTAGFDAYLGKPYSFEELLTVLRTLLETTPL